MYLIVTKPIHVEKICNYLNQYTNLKYVITTEKPEIHMFDYDIGISYCCPFIIKDFDKKPWYNYHPAPLPEYPGISNYSKPIKDKVTEFGVTVHRMTDKVDMGPIVRKKMFKLESVPVNSNELGNIAHYYLFQLFKETIGGICNESK
jgi:methionyl-tRNA formyltransferase